MINQTYLNMFYENLNLILPINQRYRINSLLPESRIPYTQDNEMWASSDRARSLISSSLWPLSDVKPHISSSFDDTSLPIIIKKIIYYERKECFLSPDIHTEKIWFEVFNEYIRFLLLTLRYSVKHWNIHPKVSIDLWMWWKKIMFDQGYGIM